ncbi:hypothetical protein D9619_003213 [Psilocybe cf. subviscida]|uniref:Elongator complex protein 5 n=1 Tax=Psilocybe cf. subviscida TaxID=2480587 RepID=A0A8H5AWY3_9AGAR|nr:hypothetical protein D9619_003213 [Psilocybe cf. subviscida]
MMSTAQFCSSTPFTMTLLSTVLEDTAHRQPLVVLQSNLAQSALPILREIVDATASEDQPRHIQLFCLLYPPSSLVYNKSESLEAYDWTDRIPEYNDANSLDVIVQIAETALEGSSKPRTIIIDSIDTLLEDSGSLSATYKSLAKLYSLVKKRTDARLILHSQSPCSLLPLITQTAFSSSIAHVIAHPPALLAHLATEFLMPPPPLSPMAKFWGVFMPVSERIHDTERLVFGPTGEGSSSPAEFVVELIVRDGAGGRKRGVERVLEGWAATAGGSCELGSLQSLKPLMTKKTAELPQSAPDPTQNLPFNLSLTSSQQESRASVPLPYAHEGTPVPSTLPGAIFYDPDSADDIDDDDPDEDLDI